MSDKQLYRDPVNGKLTGVCAGVANYLGTEIWLIRILVVSAALLGGSFFVILAYIAFTLMLEKQPYDHQMRSQAKEDLKLKSKAWQAGQTPSQLIDSVQKELANVEKKTQQIEAYVTSDTFKVNREFNSL